MRYVQCIRYTLSVDIYSERMAEPVYRSASGRPCVTTDIIQWTVERILTTNDPPFPSVGQSSHLCEPRGRCYTSDTTDTLWGHPSINNSETRRWRMTLNTPNKEGDVSRSAL